MSNIIILAGSERKDGNTDMLVDAFKKGAAKKNKVEVISARSHDINPCIGCNSCFTRPGNECFQKDDMQMVLVQGAKDKGDVKNTDGLDRAYELGLSIGFLSMDSP